MAIFRVLKNKNYTVMANYHLRDKNISLKACGLLSKMLSLPEEWSFSIEGLASICKEEYTAVKSAIDELIEAGYINRVSRRDDKGHFKGYDYNVYECPKAAELDRETEDEEDAARKGKNPNAENPGSGNPCSDIPCPEEPWSDEPGMENPKPDIPSVEKRRQLNTNSAITNPKKYRKNKIDDHHHLEKMVLPDEAAKQFRVEDMLRYLDAIGGYGLQPPEDIEIRKEETIKVAKALYLISQGNDELAEKALEPFVLDTIVRRMPPEHLACPVSYVKQALKNMK